MMRLSLLRPDNTRFFATSTPVGERPTTSTLAYDWEITESIPITPMYLDIRDYTSAEEASNFFLG
jgi:hypothetical protein